LNRKTFTQKQIGTASSAEDTRKAEVHLDAIFRAFPHILFYIDEDGTILELRAGDPSLLYSPPEQFIGKKLQETLPASLGDEIRKAIEETKTTGRITVVQYKLETKRGERWFNAHFVIALESKITVIVRDVTEHILVLERVQTQLNRLAALRSIDAAIMASFDIKVTLSVVLREITSQLRADAADVLLFNPNNKSLEFAAGQGFRNPQAQRSPLRLGQGYAGKAILERQTVHASNADSDTSGLTRSADSEREGFVSTYVVPLLMKGEIKGVLEIYHRARVTFTEDESEFLDMIAGHIAIAIEDSNLFNDLQRSNVELVRAYDGIIEGWSRAMDMRDQETEGHSLRVAELALRLARQMGINESDLVHIRRGALLHDMGKLGIPDPILLKSDPLTDEEQALMRMQPKFAYDLLAPVTYLRPALDIPYSFHERWDGSGYPRGLKGDQIPLAARIFAVVNAWDLFTSAHPSRSARTGAEARRQIVADSGVLFDPAIVKAFLKMIDNEASG
jgi:HD-GYP domain-containing protein (c-di-GMP phosphodiesterase class II)